VSRRRRGFSADLTAGGRLAQELLDPGFERPPAGLAQMDLADLPHPDPTAAADQIEGGPVLVAEGPPVGVVVVEELREVETPPADLGLDGRPLALERELGRVDADDREPAIGVAARDVPDPGNRPDAVRSAEGPDVEEDDPPRERRPGGRGADPPSRIRGESGDEWRWRCPDGGSRRRAQREGHQRERVSSPRAHTSLIVATGRIFPASAARALSRRV
jgi:hypothetical protein